MRETLNPEVPATSADGHYPYQLFKPAIGSYEFAYAVRALFVRCSYEFARARTHPRTTRRARLVEARNTEPRTAHTSLPIPIKED